MDLWRLERLRLTRTSRLWVLLGIYAFFGALGPITARYIEQILSRFGGSEMAGLQLPAPTPPDGIAQFTSNASQLGVLAVVVVAAGALTIDAVPEFGAFLRTRVRSARALMLPRLVTVTTAAVAALVVGTLLAVAITVPLLGALDPGAVVLGTVAGAVYLAMAVAITAAVAARSSSVLSTVLLTVAVLLALPLLALVPGLADWVPSELVGAIDALLRGAPGTEVVPPLLAGLVATTVAATLAVRWQAQAER